MTSRNSNLRALAAIITKNKSPLGASSSQYQIKKKQKGNILDTPKKGLLELYPSGYTKPSPREKNAPRQNTYRKIYEIAQSLGKEGKLYPFDKQGDHYIDLQPEIDNPHDSNAIFIILKAKKGSHLYELNEKDLGYIPMKISKLVKVNIRMFTGGAILKVRKNVHNKYWQCKIVLSYNDTLFVPLESTARNRFSAIIGG